jgi:hypothetical protein
MLLSLFISLVSCKGENKYPPRESTEEEASTVMTMQLDGKTYDIKYELYRALFVSYADEFDGGDRSFWASEESAEAKRKINERIVEYAADIYAVLHHAEKLGLEPYSKKNDEIIAEHIRRGVEGSAEHAIEGFGGDYEAYLEWLSYMGLNYSAHTLILRYAIVYDDIITYYSGTVDSENPTLNMSDGALEYTDEDVLKFYNSSDCVRVSVIELNSAYIDRKTAEERRNKIAAFTDTEDALNYAVSLTAGLASDIIDGVVIGSVSLDSAYYGDVTEAAFNLRLGETSEVIDVFTDLTEEYWILYRQDKTEEFYESHKTDIENVYRAQKINEIILGVKDSLIKSVSEKDAFASVDLSKIK